MSELRSSVTNYCAEIGRDPLLVQGAGGNVSWKEGSTLWIKASGTRLSEADAKDVFVPVDLDNLRTAINQGNFTAEPQLKSPSKLKPSIETPLHALMSQQIVVHLHAVEILTRLVRTHCKEELELLLGDSVSWVLIDYIKPGPDLAKYVHDALKANANVNVLFLKNHGVVVGGADLSEVRQIFNAINLALTTNTIDVPSPRIPISEMSEYIPVNDSKIHRLAIENPLFQRLKTDWTLYPDHVVFLGSQAHTYQSWDEFKKACTSINQHPELIFIQNAGVFISRAFTQTKMEQLRCYYEIIIRQSCNTALESLSQEQVGSLINWDAEKYRISLSK